MKNILKKCISIVCLFPLIVGTIGYYISGDTFTNCLYASFALYFTNPISDVYNGFVEFARWTAPLVTVSAILCVLKNGWDNIVWRIKGFSKDSVAVYTDDNKRISFGKGVKAAYLGDSFKGYFKSYIIMFSSDDKNLRFYEENKHKLNNKSVYIGFSELEQGLIQNFGGVTLFDINRSISRILWKNIGLWRKKKEQFDVVIYGNGALSRQILSTGLQLNLFSRNQSIHYHLITEDSSFELRHQELRLMNDDKVSYHIPESAETWEAIRRADIVIFSDLPDCGLLQDIIVNAKESVYYYSPEKGDIGEKLDFGNIIPFGRNEEILTDDNIRSEKLIKKAKELNKKYADENPEFGKSWEELSGFLKESNISSADYIDVVSCLIDDREDVELAELEHIRWCRFHYLNYWKYSELRDNKKRLHNDLKPFRDLSETEKAKDYTVIEIAKRERCGHFHGNKSKKLQIGRAAETVSSLL